MSAPLSTVVQHLHDIAPLELAAEWDNVGLLLQPSHRQRVARILLAIDLTDAVADEAIRAGAQLVVAYHPPIFTPLRRLPGDRLVRLIEKRVAVYSPHTALDAAAGGVNDWLASGLGASDWSAIEPAASSTQGATPRVGQGRLVTLSRSSSLAAITRRVKQRLGLRWVRVAAAAAHRDGGRIRRIALCAGAGGAVVTRAAAADLYLTGEMRHHDILAANARGTSVILTDHSHSERGYLAELRRELRARLGPTVDVVISRTDREPLATR